MCLIYTNRTLTRVTYAILFYMAKHNDIGVLGESIARTFLKKKGLRIIENNYQRAWGEIDIIARDKQGITHFVEVKSTARSYTSNNTQTPNHDEWQPEEMIHSHKIKRLRRIIQTYVLQHTVDEWVFDVVIVFINYKTRSARCKYIKDIVL